MQLSKAEKDCEAGRTNVGVQMWDKSLGHRVPLIRSGVALEDLPSAGCIVGLVARLLFDGDGCIRGKVDIDITEHETTVILPRNSNATFRSRVLDSKPAQHHPSSLQTHRGIQPCRGKTLQSRLHFPRLRHRARPKPTPWRVDVKGVFAEQVRQCHLKLDNINKYAAVGLQ